MLTIRRLLLPFLLAFGLGLSATGPAQACAFCGSSIYKIVNVNNWASLRQTPSTKARRLDKVPRGEQVIATGQTHNTLYHEWFEVFYDGRTGWIPTDYLAYQGIFGEPGTGSSQPGVGHDPIDYNNASSCGGIVRSRPDMGSRKLRSLRQGERVEILSGTGVWMNGYEWFQIQFGGRSGYQWGGILSADDQRSGSYIGC